MKTIDLMGKRFGELVVSARAGSAPITGFARWRCRCDCGETTVVNGTNLRAGVTRSCGHLRETVTRELKTKHGHRRGGVPPTREYDTWCTMIKRCENPNFIGYADYGGRGIKVCKRWRDSFENFLADVGARPRNKTSIDRINNDGNYEPGNVRWATRKQQANNRRPRSR